MPVTDLSQINKSQQVLQSQPLYKAYQAEQERIAKLNADLFNQQRGIVPTTARSSSMEQIIRPFLLIDSRPPAPAGQQALLPGEGDEAFISWGQPSSFIRPPTDPVSAGPGEDLYDQLGGSFRVNFPRSSGNKNKDDPREIEWTFIRAEFETVKIFDPQDSTNYIEVKRYTDVWFRDRGDGNTYHLTGFRWD